jgi:hypothetical protein
VNKENLSLPEQHQHDYITVLMQDLPAFYLCAAIKEMHMTWLKLLN